jgi:hypothetical protein
MIGYANQLVGGEAGLPDDAREFILDQLRAAAPVGADGYDQHFGLLGCLTDPVQAVKQGWMIAENGDWVHNSTAIDGDDGRYLVAVFAQEPASFGDDHARQTIDRVVRILFPTGSAAQPESSGTAAPHAPASKPLTARDAAAPGPVIRPPLFGSTGHLLDAIGAARGR